MFGSGGVLVHVFTSFRHLLLRNRVSYGGVYLVLGRNLYSESGTPIFRQLLLDFRQFLISPDDKYHI